MIPDKKLQYHAIITPIRKKVPHLAAKDYTFDPTTYIPHIGQQ